MPAGKEVAFIPGALAMAEEDKDAGHEPIVEVPGPVAPIPELECFSLRISVTHVGNLV
jgi:hypothetical protein